MKHCFLCKELYSPLNKRSFHTFPRDAVLRTKWLNNLKLPISFEVKSQVICSDHFSEDSFHEAEGRQKMRLITGALPLALGDEKKNNLSEHGNVKGVQTYMILSPAAAKGLSTISSSKHLALAADECPNSSEPDGGPSSKSETTCRDVVGPPTGLVTLPQVVLSTTSNSRSLLVGPLQNIHECPNSSETDGGPSSRSETTCRDDFEPHTGLVTLPQVVLSTTSNSRSLLVGPLQNIHECPNSSEPNGGPSSRCETTCRDVVGPPTGLVTLPQVVLSKTSNSRSLLVGHPQNIHVVEAFRNLTPPLQDMSDRSIYLPVLGEASGSLTTSHRDRSDRPFCLPAAKEIITSVYHYLQTEYEYLKTYIGSNCDLTPLSNILKRTAEATGVSEQTVTSLLEKGKHPLESTRQTVQRKRAKSSHYSSYEDDDVSPNEEESSCEDLREGQHLAYGHQQQSSHEFETLQVEFEEEEDHKNAVNERMRVDVEATPSKPMRPRRRRRSNLGRKTRNAKKQAKFRSNQTAQQRAEQKEIRRIRILQSRTTHRFQAEGPMLNKAPKTSAERAREFRARKALLKQLSKKQQEPDAIAETRTMTETEKRAKSAEATRRWRENKKGVSDSSKKQAKTAAQRMREYRARKKLTRCAVHHEPPSEHVEIKLEPSDTEYWHQNEQESEELERLKMEFEEEEYEDHRNAVRKKKCDIKATTCDTQQSSEWSQNIIIETGHSQDQLNITHTINVTKNSKNKERQQRYREKNREKLKRNQAERRNRKRCLQSMAGSSASSNINRTEVINKEITDGNSQSSSGLEGTETSSIHKQSKEKNALQRKRERQRRYREQNREKLKKCEAERRQRLLNSDRDSLVARTSYTVHHKPPSEHVEIKQEPSDIEYGQTSSSVHHEPPTEHVEIKQEPSDTEYWLSTSAVPRVPPDAVHHPVKREPTE